MENSKSTSSDESDDSEGNEDNETSEDKSKSKSKSGKGNPKEKEKEEEKEGSGNSEEQKEEEEQKNGESENSEKEEKSEEEKKKEQEQKEQEEIDKELEEELEKRKKELEELEEKKKLANKLKKLTQAEINRITAEFKNAMNEIVEESVVHSHISGFQKSTKIIFETPLQIDTIFKEEDKRVAETLIKMLDISFDPAKDVVKNLRLGKLDVNKIAEVPAGNISIYKQEVENQATKPFSVVILCDESGSMGSGYNVRGEGDKLYYQ